MNGAKEEWLRVQDSSGEDDPRVCREVAKLKAERNILKKRGLLLDGLDMKFAFIAKH